MKKTIISVCALLALSSVVYAAGTTFGTSVTSPTFIGNLTGNVTGDITGDVAGAVSATTLDASGATTLSGAVTVEGTGTSRWDNAAGKIDTAAIEDGALNVAAVICDSVTSAGAISGTTIDTAGDLTINAGVIQATQVNIATTNGYVITVGASSTIVLDASGQGTGTITNTIIAPASAGQWAVLINDGVSNSVTIAEGTTLDSGGDKTLGPEDVMLLFAPSAASWSAIYHDN